METVYYHLNARKVKVSGGADLLTFVPVADAAPAGEILDFDRCRRKLETKAAWKDLERAARAAEPSHEDGDGGEADSRPRRSSRRERAAGWLELAASAGVILVSLSAALAFLELL